MPKNLKNLVATISETHGQDGKYFRFGLADNFPNLLAHYVNDSGTAKVCVDRLDQFLYGQGFNSETFGKVKANSKETWRAVLVQIVSQVNYFEGIAIQVLFDAGGRPARYQTIDIQHLRKRSDGLFIYNPDLGDPVGYNVSRRYTNMILPAFRIAESKEQELSFAPQRRELVADQINEYGEQMGEILYVYKKGIGLNYDVYPIPTYASGLGDLAADAGLSTTENNIVSNQFKADTIITTHVMDATTLDENDETEKDRFNNSIANFTGADGSSVLHLEADITNGQAPTVDALNNQHKMDATEQATDRIAKKVCRWFSVPPVLVGIDTAGKLGDNQELVNKLKLFNLTLEGKREMIKTAMVDLFPAVPEENFELQKLDLFDHIPDEVVKTLTAEQKNEIYNLPLPEQTTIETTEKIDNGTIN